MSQFPLPSSHRLDTDQPGGTRARFAAGPFVAADEKDLGVGGYESRGSRTTKVAAGVSCRDGGDRSTVESGSLRW